MDRKKILEEGFLEKYLLDELTDSERNTIESALQEDIELKKQFDLLEADFEHMAFENALEPHVRVKESLQRRLENKKVRRLHNIPFYAAASFALLFLLTSFFLYTKWQNAQRDLNSIQIETTVLKERLNVFEEKTEVANTKLNTINGPNIIPFVLTGNEKLPNSRAVAYINHAEKRVVVNSAGLPQLPKDQTYQMWSDVNGAMIDMGLLSPSEELVTLKYIDKAESLNITIEPAGGSEHPTVEKLISYVTL